LADAVGAKPEAENEIDVELLVQWFEDSQESTEDARKASERNRDYYDGKQLTSAEKKKLRERGQPDIILNRIQPKIDYLLGFEAASRTDPRAFPRNPQDEDASEAATDAIRFLSAKTELDQKNSAAWEHMLIEGYGGIELIYNKENNEIDATEWAWDRLFYDPHSRKHDFSDARYLGGVVWMDEDDARRKWPDSEDIINDTTASATMDRTYDDRPSWQNWTQGKGRKRVRICQIYYKDGHQWKWCVFTKGGKLDGGDVPFVDAKGMSWCPLLMQSAYVDRDNNRYGLVNIMIGPQDEVNKRRSKALHLLTMRQTLGEDGSVEDVNAVKTELAKPDGHVVVNPGFRFELLNTNDMAQGHLSLLQEAKQEIELIGPNSAMLGTQDGAPSGRAILANQQGGQTELTRLLDRHRHLKRRVYEHMWDMVRQYKGEEWWVRVTDNENNVKFVGLNRPVTMGEELTTRIVDSMLQQGMDEQQAQQAAQQRIQQLIQSGQINPMELEQVVRTENQPTEMDMDITLEEAPNVANVQEEQFKTLAELAGAGIAFPPEVYIRASSLRNKDELLEIIGSQNQAQSSPMDDAVLQKTLAEVEEIKAATATKKAELPKHAAAAMKTMAEAEQVGADQLQPAGVPFDQQTGLPVQ
jgi:hypothetical protein